MNRRWRGARSALPGQRWSPPWPFVEPPPPERPPTWLHQAGRPWPFPALRRGRTWSPPWPFVELPPAGSIPRWVRGRPARQPATGRSATWWDPPPAPPTLPAARLGARIGRLPHSRHGRRFDPPWPSEQAAPLEWTPPNRVASRPWSSPRSWTLLSRGAHWSPPWPDIAPAPPTQWVPPPVGARRRYPRTCRTGRYFNPPWLEPPGPYDPGIWQPGFCRQSGRPLRGVPVAGRSWSPPWPHLPAAVCETPRPSSGVSVRPSSGTTARPDTGTTEEPC